MSGAASEEECIWSAPGQQRVGERIHATGAPVKSPLAHRYARPPPAIRLFGARCAAIRKSVVEFNSSTRHEIGGKVRLGTSPSFGSHQRPPLTIVRCLRDAPNQRVRITGRKKPSGHSIDDQLAKTADPACHNRSARRHRFERGKSEAFFKRRHHQKIPRCQELLHVCVPAKKAHPLAHTKAQDERAQRRFRWAGAGNLGLNINTFRRKEGSGFDQGFDILQRNQPGESSQPERPGLGRSSGGLGTRLDARIDDFSPISTDAIGYGLGTRDDGIRRGKVQL